MAEQVNLQNEQKNWFSNKLVTDKKIILHDGQMHLHHKKYSYKCIYTY